MATSNTEKGLVSNLAGQLLSGLSALQNSGMTPRLWRRIALDQDFRRIVMEGVHKADTRPTGQSCVLPANEWSHASLYKALLQWRGLLDELVRRPQVAALFDPDAEYDEIDETREKYETTTLFITPICYRLSQEELGEELAARKLSLAGFTDALRFALEMVESHREWLPAEMRHMKSTTLFGPSIFVPGAWLTERREDRKQRSFLSFFCDGSRGFRFHLDLEHREFGAGNYVLTKRIAE